MWILGMGIGLLVGFFINAKASADVGDRQFSKVCFETAPAYFSLASAVMIGALFTTKVFG